MSTKVRNLTDVNNRRNRSELIIFVTAARELLNFSNFFVGLDMINSERPSSSQVAEVVQRLVMTLASLPSSFSRMKPLSQRYLSVDPTRYVARIPSFDRITDVPCSRSVLQQRGSLHLGQ